jgi:hypothetical protein
MKLEAGRQYICRDGKISGIIEQFPNITFVEHVFRDASTGWTYRVDGGWNSCRCVQDGRDLVKEYRPCAPKPPRPVVTRWAFAWAIPSILDADGICCFVSRSEARNQRWQYNAHGNYVLGPIVRITIPGPKP